MLSLYMITRQRGDVKGEAPGFVPLIKPIVLRLRRMDYDRPNTQLLIGGMQILCNPLGVEDCRTAVSDEDLLYARLCVARSFMTDQGRLLSDILDCATLDKTQPLSWTMLNFVRVTLRDAYLIPTEESCDAEQFSPDDIRWLTKMLQKMREKKKQIEALIVAFQQADHECEWLEDLKQQIMSL